MVLFDWKTFSRPMGVFANSDRFGMLHLHHLHGLLPDPLEELTVYATRQSERPYEHLRSAWDETWQLSNRHDLLPNLRTVRLRRY